MRSHADIEAALISHGPAVWRACVLHFRTESDAQDAYQDTFLKYALADDATFENEEHRKAWLLRVATNTCKDMLKAAARKNVSLDDGMLEQSAISKDPLDQPDSLRSDVIDVLRNMDDPPRTPLYLSLIEEYPATEIARMLSAPTNTVYSWISRGKKLLKEALQ